MAESDWFFARGALARDEWETVVDDGVPGWQHTALRIGGQGSFDLPGDETERMIVPLDARHVTIEHEGGVIQLVGRASVFDGPADVAYLGIATAATVRADGRFAVAEAPATRSLPASVIRASDIAIELRGAGQSSRQVHNFGTPGAPAARSLDAENLIVCEVLTPAGNWSSYPPHKHDEAIAGRESRLEEIYYFESAVERGAAQTRAHHPGDPFGLFVAYSSPGHPISIDRRVRSGDVALVPHGYHGPAVAAPGYDLYYLNVMAGPDPDRTWLISDDPAHGWVRGSWEGQTRDERLPFAGEKSRR